tara:strand:- start:691 stop:1272 length:582 start_codon:yes stop_codon:yes gene_type:complete
MAITLNGNGTITGYTPTITTSMLPAGSVIQTVSAGSNVYENITMGATLSTWVAITKIDCDITTSVANSKFLLSGNIFGEPATDDHDISFRVGRQIGGTDASDLFIGADGDGKVTFKLNQGYSSGNEDSTPSSNSFSNLLDSPNQSAGTTIKYRVYISVSSSAVAFHLNRALNSATTYGYERGYSNLTVMEIAV